MSGAKDRDSAVFSQEDLVSGAEDRDSAVLCAEEVEYHVKKLKEKLQQTPGPVPRDSQ